MGSTASRDITGFYDKVDLIDNEPTLIIEPFLYLGGMYARKNPRIIEYLGITHVLNMAGELHLDTVYLTNRNVNVKHIPADDYETYNIRQHFEEAFQFIEEALAKGGRILVHCAVGVSRSPTIVIAYIMYRYGMSFQAALQYVQNLRPLVNPNNSFKRQLQEFEYEIMNMNRTPSMGHQVNAYSSKQPQQQQQQPKNGGYLTKYQLNQMDYESALNKVAATSNYNFNSMNPNLMRVGSKRNYSHNTDPNHSIGGSLPQYNYMDQNYMYQNSNNNYYAEQPYTEIRRYIKRTPTQNITKRKQERPESYQTYNNDFDDSRSNRRSYKSTDTIKGVNRRYSDNMYDNKSFEKSKSRVKPNNYNHIFLDINQQYNDVYQNSSSLNPHQ